MSDVTEKSLVSTPNEILKEHRQDWLRMSLSGKVIAKPCFHNEHTTGGGGNEENKATKKPSRPQGLNLPANPTELKCNISDPTDTLQEYHQIMRHLITCRSFLFFLHHQHEKMGFSVFLCFPVLCVCMCTSACLLMVVRFQAANCYKDAQQL